MVTQSQQVPSHPVPQKDRHGEFQGKGLPDGPRFQEEYLLKQREINLSSKDPRILATLFFLNGAKRAYSDDLERLSLSIPPVERDCRISLLMPVYREEMNIEHTLRCWASQLGMDGKPMDPGLFEVLVLANRPDSSVPWDRSEDIAKDIADATGCRIHVLKHTFSFLPETMERDIRGVAVKLSKGAKMGLVFKLAADIALLRGLERGIAPFPHLMHPTGADVYSRSPHFLHEVFGQFGGKTDFAKLHFVIPPRVCLHMPLLWALHEYRMAISEEYFGKQHLKRHGVFTSDAYAKVGGFSPEIGVGEDTHFGRRIISSGSAVSHMATPLVADNPRRSISAIIGGCVLVAAYSGFGLEDGGMRQLSMEGFLSQELHPNGKLTPSNFGKHASGHFRHYLRRGINEGRGFDEAFANACRCAGSALKATGFKEGDFGFVKGDAAHNCRIAIKSISNLLLRFEGYASLERPEWMKR